MDDLAFLRERIESYADYTNDDTRRLTEEQIRAYAGEALAHLAERLQPGGADGEELARLLFRCQFADQSVVRGLDTEGEDAEELAALHRADRAIVELADRADGLGASQLAPYFAELDTALDTRGAIIKASLVKKAIPPAR